MPRRIQGSVCDVHAALNGTFGVAVVLEREGKGHREVFAAMVILILFANLDI